MKINKKKKLKKNFFLVDKVRTVTCGNNKFCDKFKKLSKRNLHYGISTFFSIKFF